MKGFVQGHSEKLDLDLGILPSSEVFLPYHKLEISLVMGMIQEGQRQTCTYLKAGGCGVLGLQWACSPGLGQGCLYC